MSSAGINRRELFSLAGYGAIGAALYGTTQRGVIFGGGSLTGTPARALALNATVQLSDPASQPKFKLEVPNAADPAFSYKAKGKQPKYTVEMGPSMQNCGLVDAYGNSLLTNVFGYGEKGVYTWPGKTIFANTNVPVEVKWKNKLLDPLTGIPLSHLLPVDETLHWAYSLNGYTQFSIANDGIPVVAHLHGGHTDWPYDGNPEFFFGPGYNTRGPQWLDKSFLYSNDQQAGTLWYHDHALGITRLNVYAGLAGFYLLRDDLDTGKADNPLGLPAFPYEYALAIQDRMFTAGGQLFYPAFPGDPAYGEFIDDEGAFQDPYPQNPNPGGLSALAEFFGDHMVVNGLIWPKATIEPRKYRLRLLNGCDSRFLNIWFEVEGSQTRLDIQVVGSDQGLAHGGPVTVSELLMETGSRYDLVVDFSQANGERVVVRNNGGDAPFGGDLPGEVAYEHTDKIMAFDVTAPLDPTIDDRDLVPEAFPQAPIVTVAPDNIRKVALFEGRDEYGRLQPLLGTAEPVIDAAGNEVTGALPWHTPTTENPALGSTEEWQIFNMTGDAHPVHLHLVHFEVIDRHPIVFDTNADPDGFLPDGVEPSGDGSYLVPQPVIQHNGTEGVGFRIENATFHDATSIDPGPNYVENAPKDMVTALPGQVTRIKATFDKPGRYVWHCHILSHEDHEMMRILHVGPGA